jgi:hypothetical protein
MLAFHLGSKDKDKELEMKIKGEVFKPEVERLMPLDKSFPANKMFCYFLGRCPVPFILKTPLPYPLLSKFRTATV